MKKKVTLTFTDELVDTISYLSTVMQKNQNDIMETAFWNWWQEQDEILKNSIQEMIIITQKVRESNK
ncbi:hypothetical protein [Clostridium polynesiense]|uniref:hypothetical protein n=1 Tax=Clostridium polynesiense TaxID=1325933 RepID=UPI00058B1C8A|nr:hypothetical protein [Clostridium polynesiense]